MRKTKSITDSEGTALSKFTDSSFGSPRLALSAAPTFGKIVSCITGMKLLFVSFQLPEWICWFPPNSGLISTTKGCRGNLEFFAGSANFCTKILFFATCEIPLPSLHQVKKLSQTKWGMGVILRGLTFHVPVFGTFVYRSHLEKFLVWWF